MTKKNAVNKESPSARKVWIEIEQREGQKQGRIVTFREEGVD